MTAVTASIEIAAPPERVWDVIMDPSHFGDWVTIHRKLGHVDDGTLREGFKVEQTLCLHHANFKVRWSLAEVDAPHRAVWEGKGPGRLARSHRRRAGRRSTAARRRASSTATSTPSRAASSAAWRAACWWPAPRTREATRSLQRLKAYVER